jgi:hypothetical protein
MAFHGQDMEFAAQKNGITARRNGITACKSIEPQLKKFSRSLPSRHIPSLQQCVSVFDELNVSTVTVVESVTCRFFDPFSHVNMGIYYLYRILH